MNGNILSFSKLIRRLERYYGRPKAPKITDPLGLILWENVAYLANDEKREKAYQALRKQVGTGPKQIRAASRVVLNRIAKAGILAENQVEKLKKIADLVLEDFEGDLKQVLDWPTPKVKKALKKFPGIGDPGAEKILLFSRKEPVLALESNGLRVLLRVGFGEESQSYSKSYRSAQAAVEGQIQKDFVGLIAAHQLLRRHGQEICKRTKPLCRVCPLAEGCAFFTTKPESD